MTLEIQQDESARRAVRRIGRKRARNALKAIAECESMEAVHAARKQIKQLRALLRLARSGVRPKANRKLMRCLKETASVLARPRDAFVKASALSSLQDYFKRELAGHDFHFIRTRLERERIAQQQRMARHLKKTRLLFKCICRHFDALEVTRGGWRLIGRGLACTYRDGRRAYRVALESERHEDLHEWRKRVKDLDYHVELLCCIWPEQMHAMLEDLDKLGDCLGDAHDLWLLTDEGNSKDLRAWATDEAELLLHLAERRRSELRMQAFALGERLYAEKPGLFCKRLKSYWKRWRKSVENAAK